MAKPGLAGCEKDDVPFLHDGLPLILPGKPALAGLGGQGGQKRVLGQNPQGTNRPTAHNRGPV